MRLCEGIAWGSAIVWASLPCRDNVEDALEKLQASLDRAAESIIPAKEDPAKAKEMAKRYNTPSAFK